MKDPLFIEYVSERVDWLSSLAVKKIDDRHATAFEKLLAHLRQLYRVRAADFGVVAIERIQTLVRCHQGKEIIGRYVPATETHRIAEKVIELDFKEGEELKGKLVEELSDLIKRRHSESLSAIGPENEAPLIYRKVAKHRTPVCWRCHKHLDNRLFLECNICRWIICICGACGCGAPRK